MFGKTLLSKMLNTIVLVILLGYAASKVLPMLGIEPALEIVSKEVVTINKHELLDFKVLESKLSLFKIDELKLAEVLASEGSSVNEFSKQVHTDFVIPENLTGEKSITLEFVTNKTNPKFKAGYKNIAEQLSEFLNSPNI